MSVIVEGIDIPKYCGDCFVGNRAICHYGCPLKEVRHGKWIPVEKYGLHKCSVCKYEYRIEPVESFKFCPNCGARMDG